MLFKKDLVEIIADQNGLTKKDAGEAIDLVVNGIKSVLAQNESVTLSGFAKFSTEHKEAHKRVLGFTGEMIEVPAHYVHKAKLSPALAK